MRSPEEKMQEKRKETKITHTKWDAEHFLMENSLVSQCVCTQHSISFSLDICSPRVQHLVRSLMFSIKLPAALRIFNICSNRIQVCNYRISWAIMQIFFFLSFFIGHEVQVLIYSIQPGCKGCIVLQKNGMNRANAVC